VEGPGQDELDFGEACLVNGIDELTVTDVDGLDSVENIKVCIGYSSSNSGASEPRPSWTTFGR
jgi:adenylosuccinate synthase